MKFIFSRKSYRWWWSHKPWCELLNYICNCYNLDDCRCWVKYNKNLAEDCSDRRASVKSKAQQSDEVVLLTLVHSFLCCLTWLARKLLIDQICCPVVFTLLLTCFLVMTLNCQQGCNTQYSHCDHFPLTLCLGGEPQWIWSCFNFNAYWLISTYGERSEGHRGICQGDIIFDDPCANTRQQLLLAFKHFFC